MSVMIAKKQSSAKDSDSIVDGVDPEDAPIKFPDSPRWGAATKMVVGLALVTIFAFLLFRFLHLIGPLLLAFILAYLLYPIAVWVNKKLHLSWRASITILYLLVLILLLGSITLGGFTVVEQTQNLIRFLTNALSELPTFFDEVTSHPFQIGPFSFDMGLLDFNNLSQQILGVVQPVLSRAGSSIVTVASGAASFLGWIFFIFLVSYFIAAESNGFRLISFSIPGYVEDAQQLGKQLGIIWNAFLRGQISIVLITIVMYTVMLGVFGVRFYFGLALLAGLARFVPYVGPLITWTTYGLVTFFQGSTIFGISPLAYAGLVVGTGWIMDVFIDNYVTPRLMSHALKVHPAAVMVSALMAFNLLGVIGVVLAAPVLATLKLLLGYVFAKLFDRNPWGGMTTISPPMPISESLQQFLKRAQSLALRVIQVFRQRKKVSK